MNNQNKREAVEVDYTEINIQYTILYKSQLV